MLGTFSCISFLAANEQVRKFPWCPFAQATHLDVTSGRSNESLHLKQTCPTASDGYLAYTQLRVPTSHLSSTCFHFICGPCIEHINDLSRDWKTTRELTVHGMCREIVGGSVFCFCLRCMTRHENVNRKFRLADLMPRIRNRLPVSYTYFIYLLIHSAWCNDHQNQLPARDLHRRNSRIL